MQPLVDTIAHAFSEGSHAYLTEEQMQAVVERNRAETAPGACHLHDFCDNRTTLDEVFLLHGMDPAAGAACTFTACCGIRPGTWPQGGTSASPSDRRRA